MFIVKFINLTESTIEGRWEYSNLMDALKVCKETNLSSSAHIPALSDERFNECLLELLTSAIVYTGAKTPQYPDGEIMIILTRFDKVANEETSVYSALPMPFIPGQAPIPQIKVSENIND